MKRLAPSILSADFSRLGEHVGEIEKNGADIIHVDVMDGHFVPNISFGAGVMKSLLGKTKLPFDVHLMIENPDMYIGDFITDNTEFVTVHQEACRHLHRTVRLIKDYGVKAGVAINPATPVCMLDDILEDVDMVLVMSVNPGFGGQKLIPRAIDKIRELDSVRYSRDLSFEIEVDGGATADNIKHLIDAGTDIVVAGSAVFKGDIEKNIEAFKKQMV